MQGRCAVLPVAGLAGLPSHCRSQSQSFGRTVSKLTLYALFSGAPTYATWSKFAYRKRDGLLVQHASPTPGLATTQVAWAAQTGPAPPACCLIASISCGHLDLTLESGGYGQTLFHIA